MAVPRSPSERRKQLAEFLKHLRSQASPEEAGFTRGRRRRTPGLRREEVAELIGVGTDWYAWLEQGRDVNPSNHLLNKIAEAFHLTGDQLTYFRRLAKPQPELSASDSTTVSPRIVQLVSFFRYLPAYVRNMRWDILAWNAAHAKVFGDSSRVPIERRNMLWLIFTDAQRRSTTLNWDVVAQQVIAKFRADWSRNPEDKRAEQLVHELLETSPEFANWWRQYRTTETLTHPVELAHPVAGRITLERVHLRPELDLQKTISVYMPIGTQSTARLKKLCA